MTILKSLSVLISLALVTALLTSLRAEDVTISSAVDAPQLGQGGTFTVTPTGTISGTGNGIVAQTGNEITTLTVDGVVVTGTAASGVQNSAGSTMSAIDVSGTIQGGWAIRNDGSIGSISNTGLIEGTRESGILGTANSSLGQLTNAGTIDSVKTSVSLWTTGTVANLAGGLIRSAGENAVFLNGVTTLLTNAGTISSGSNLGHGIEVGAQALTESGALTTAVNSGLIEGGSAMIIRPLMTLGTLTNSGTFRGNDYGILIQDQAGTVSNLAGGLIEATGYGALAIDDGSLASLDNAGTMLGAVAGISTGGSFGITALTNSGTISGPEWAGIEMYATGTSTLSNSGVITGYYGIDAARGTLTTLINSGTMSGAVHGILNGARNTISTLTNEATGLIHGNDTGLYVSSTTTAPMEVTNAGWITGSNAGVRVVNSRLLKLTNTGTISFTGTNAGPAVLVGPGSVLGVASGTGGEALSSTGAGARLDGTIVNQGTVHHGFTIENQNVTVSAGGGIGTFTNGTLDVVEGDLTFVGGQTNLAANITVDGGLGTVFNEAVLGFSGLRTFDGNFSQTSSAALSSLISGANTYGSILITGDAFFAGTLDLNLVGEFALAEGQVFDLFDFDSYEGGFSGLSVNGTALVPAAGTGRWTYDSLILEERWTGTSMSIAAVPEPSTCALALVGLACGGFSIWRRRKRA